MGWLCETIACSLKEKRVILNRGFLIGPYCPIYGFGALFMILLLEKYLNDPMVLFVMAVVGASLIEYITSYLMEKLFKARWWDYSDKSFNVNGRICLINSLLFGILGLVVLYGIHPMYHTFLIHLPEPVLIGVALFLLCLFLIDLGISVVIISQIRFNASLLLKDSTYIISKQVREILSQNRVLKQRLLNAFPKAEIVNHKKLFATIRKYLKKLEVKSKK